MLLARTLRVVFLALLSLHLIGSFAAIALLGRMRPALERILERNVVSLGAVENMLVVLATQHGGSAPPEAAARFREALAIAERNVTEAEEPAALRSIRDQSEAALAGDARAMASVVTTASQLAQSNRSAIEAANHDAQALGSGGAWALALLSFITFAAGLWSLRLLDRRVLAPLSEVFEVLDAPHDQDAFRRCRPMPGAPDELAAAMRRVNALLDAMTTRRARERVAVDETAALERATLLAALDGHPGAVAIVDDNGDVVAANTVALERLAAPDGADLRGRLREAAAGRATEGIETRAIPGDPPPRRVLCRLQ